MLSISSCLKSCSAVVPNDDRMMVVVGIEWSDLLSGFDGFRSTGNHEPSCCCDAVSWAPWEPLDDDPAKKACRKLTFLSPSPLSLSVLRLALLLCIFPASRLFCCPPADAATSGSMSPFPEFRGVTSEARGTGGHKAWLEGDEAERTDPQFPAFGWRGRCCHNNGTRTLGETPWPEEISERGLWGSIKWSNRCWTVEKREKREGRLLIKKREKAKRGRGRRETGRKGRRSKRKEGTIGTERKRTRGRGKEYEKHNAM